MRGCPFFVQDTIERFLREESRARGRNLTWTKHAREIPQQIDFISCGVFICGHASLLVHSAYCRCMCRRNSCEYGQHCPKKILKIMFCPAYMSSLLTPSLSIIVIDCLACLQTQCLTEDSTREAAQIFMQSDVSDMRRRMLVEVKCVKCLLKVFTYELYILKESLYRR